MAEEKPEQRTCNMNLRVSGYGGATNSYDPSNGMEQSFALSGHIDDPYITALGDIDSCLSDSTFDNKSVRVEFSSPPDTEWLAGLHCSNACGSVVIDAHVNPEQYEHDGESFEIQPVRVIIMVDPTTFETIRRQAAEASYHRRIMNLKVTLADESLPEPKSQYGGLDLKDLDVSERRGYAIGNFEIFDTIYTDHSRDRVLEVERNSKKDYGTSLNVKLNDVRYDVDPVRSSARRIQCDGLIISRDKPYDCTHVYVEFFQHELDMSGRLPKRSFFGEYYYCPKQPGEEGDLSSFNFSLRYQPDDARNLLIPLFSQASHDKSTELILTVTLTNNESELLEATDGLDGNVQCYSFEVRKRLVDYGPALAQLKEARQKLEKSDLTMKGVTEDCFQRTCRSVLVYGEASDFYLNSLSLKQIDMLKDKLGQY
jgi:hypothetical protein